MTMAMKAVGFTPEEAHNKLLQTQVCNMIDEFKEGNGEGEQTSVVIFYRRECPCTDDHSHTNKQNCYVSRYPKSCNTVPKYNFPLTDYVSLFASSSNILSNAFDS